MIDNAGGVAALGVVGKKSYRVGWDVIAASEPAVVFAAPCGFDLSACADVARELVAAGRLPEGLPVVVLGLRGSREVVG